VHQAPGSARLVIFEPAAEISQLDKFFRVGGAGGKGVENLPRQRGQDGAEFPPSRQGLQRPAQGAIGGGREREGGWIAGPGVGPAGIDIGRSPERKGIGYFIDGPGIDDPHIVAGKILPVVPGRSVRPVAQHGELLLLPQVGDGKRGAVHGHEKLPLRGNRGPEQGIGETGLHWLCPRLFCFFRIDIPPPSEKRIFIIDQYDE
jgi:hypothetical protein